MTFIHTFSIITPSFNNSNFISETIQSVINQGDTQIQYFIKDGGSTDGTISILRQYAEGNPGRICWRSHRDQGQVEAINEGFEQASGDILAFINSDDYYLPNAFSLVDRYFDDHPEKLWVIGDCQVSDKRLKWTFWIKHIWPVEKFTFAILFYNFINQPAVFIKKEMIDKIGLFDPSLPLAFDYEFWLRCTKIQLPGRIRTPLAFFRVHKDAKSTIDLNTQVKQSYESVRRHSSNIIVLGFHRLIILVTKLVYAKIK
jgi:glycosyltransferase involved in cell wall biosynthesis